jgi:O-antigen ligase
MRGDSITRFILTALFLYLFAFGATFNGVLIPELKFFTLGIMSVLALAWVVMRRRWTWHTTPLDIALVLWGGAIALSLAANLDAWRRIAIGIWYVGVYAVVWYALTDMLANKRLKRDVLIEVILFGGLLIVFFGYFQIFSSDFDISRLELPRPGSLVGNPNSLGAFLLVLGTLAIGRAAFTRSTLARVILGIYGAIILLLIFATFSRGAWLGTATALGVLVILPLMLNGKLSLSGLKTLWRNLGGRTKALIVSLGLIAIIMSGIAGFFILDSFSESGRAIERRTGIYGDALTLFSEQPLIGHGLFTFGREFLRLESQPPSQPHAHAHNSILHVSAELGSVGLLVLALSVGVVLWQIQRNLKQATQRERALLIPATAALIGFGVHHLLDFPSMMPLIALCGLLLVIIAAYPLQAQPMTAWWRLRGHPVGIAGLTVLLLVSGWWSASIYAQYNGILAAPFGTEGTGDYRAAADDMQAIVDADPAMVIYQRTQGYLYGIAAYEGDISALPLAIQAYENAADLEPYNAIILTNLGSLHALNDDLPAAIDALEAAAAYAPSSRQIRFMLAKLYEQVGRDADARTTYKQIISDSVYFWPAWTETPIAREIWEGYMLDTERGQLIAAFGRGSDTYPALTTPRNTTEDNVLQGLAAFRNGNDTVAFIQQAERRAVTPEDFAWIAAGEALMAKWAGASAADAITEAEDYLTVDYAEADLFYGINVPYFQFLRYGIPRRFLPSVYYPPTDSGVLYLLEQARQP